MEHQHQDSLRVSKEEQMTTAGAMTRPKAGMAPEHKEKIVATARQAISRTFTKSNLSACL